MGKHSLLDHLEALNRKNKPQIRNMLMSILRIWGLFFSILRIWGLFFVAIWVSLTYIILA